MGIFSRLSGTDKYGAAQSALIAKYMFSCMTDSQRKDIETKAVDVLINGGYSRDRAVNEIGRLAEPEGYCLYAMTMAMVGIPPALKGILYNDEWYPISNPFTALLNADKQLHAASHQIKSEYGILLSLSDSTILSQQPFVEPKKVTTNTSSPPRQYTENKDQEVKKTKKEELTANEIFERAFGESVEDEVEDKPQDKERGCASTAPDRGRTLKDVPFFKPGTGTPVRLFECGGYRALLLRDPECPGNMKYLYLLIVFRAAEDSPPIMFITAEQSTLSPEFMKIAGKELGTDFGEGAGHKVFLCVFDESGHSNLGASNDYAMLDKFEGEALSVMRRQLNLHASVQVIRDLIKENGQSVKGLKLMDQQASYCPRCGSLINAGDHFCQKCGGQSSQYQSKKWKCIECGKLNDADMRRCSCGHFM